MREDIKEHIELIKQGKAPKGYKKTRFGIIPEKWRCLQLKDIAEVSSGSTPSRNNDYYWNGTIPWITTSEINYNEIKFTKEYVTEKALKELKLKLYNKGTILMAMYGQGKTRGKIAILAIEATINQACAAITVIDENNLFVYQQLVFMYEKIRRMSNVGNQANLNVDIIKNISFFMPSYNEQKTIVCTLAKYDSMIVMISKLIGQKELEKNWLMQNLLTGKKRLSGFKDKWKKIKIGSFIHEIDERSIQNNEYDILSVTKTGICLQSEHFKKQIASEDNIGYKVIHKGNLVFSTMNLWMGSLDVLREFDIGIVSPAYKVFEFDKKNMLMEFGNYFMKTGHMIWVYNINSEKGASIVRKNLDLKGLLNYVVSIPNIQEQKAIAKVLTTADREIELLEKKLELIKQEKKAMMQLLLTGIVRVNES